MNDAPSTSTATLTTLEPVPGVFAYYDGRVVGRRLHSPEPNWLDDGAFELGVASYSIVDGDEALVFDTHISFDHARAVRAHLTGLGVRSVRVVLSHWHDDHVAGNAVFSDCDIIAHSRTAEALRINRARLEAENPPIRPLVLPNRTYEDQLELTVGRRRVSLRHFNIHSADATVLWLEDDSLLLAGDVVEDTVTYIAEAAATPTHIDELARLAGLRARAILPAHGSRERIAAGGYPPDLITATRDYLRRLMAGEGRDGGSLADFLAADIAAGRVGYFAPYERVHRRNLERIAAAFPEACP